jgi:uncharacterized protein with von Willebrand factor type A (vWA) domain
MNDKNPEQRRYIKFCAKIGKSVSETLSPTTFVYGEYAIKKLEFLNDLLINQLFTYKLQ